MSLPAVRIVVGIEMRNGEQAKLEKAESNEKEATHVVKTIQDKMLSTFYSMFEKRHGRNSRWQRRAIKSTSHFRKMFMQSEEQAVGFE